ncbi:hypothetical protein LOK82_08070 [Xylella fastidiosa subsp. multiplex]|uniref:Uncharacterized protein n=1 Tax=Xylella fastidiosa subsp. multiplex TaxID=644357 RepID=A0AAW6HW64_XYLFS|nr:hypothetical protein [Xylella fastidiosa]MDC6408585.1 hypothetical protein [Xylella fastidiosa subsp. multiplex]
MSLTTAHRCGTVAGKELQNSGTSGTRIRKSCGFFVPVRFYVGRAAAIQHPQGKNCAPSSSGFEPPDTYGCGASKRLPVVISHELGDVL